MKSLYNHKWFPRILCKKPDGGKDSGVTGYFLIEWKPFFSIGILQFKIGSREAYHSHAFNAITWWLKGYVIEEVLVNVDQGYYKTFHAGQIKFTPRNHVHKINAMQDTYAFTIRGPWVDHWYEFKNGKIITLTHRRKEI